MSEMFYHRTKARSASMAATLDTVSSNGTVEGWARYTNSRLVCHIQVRVDNVMVAEDMADKFRSDLLRAGVGHGHCAFYARMAAVTPGRHKLRLFDGRTGLPVEHAGDDLQDIPPFTGHRQHSVQSLLEPRDRWDDVDVLTYPDCLQLAKNCSSMGTERFVDRVFYFALGRWSDVDGGKHYADAIRSGDMTPNDVFKAVMTSTERQFQRRPLPRPTDPDFPFVYDPIN